MIKQHALPPKEAELTAAMAKQLTDHMRGELGMAAREFGEVPGQPHDAISLPQQRLAHSSADAGAGARYYRCFSHSHHLRLGFKS